MTTNEILARFEGVKRNGSGWQAKCPAHDDKSPSLSISEGTCGRTLLRCHAGCRTKDVLAAVGLDESALFPEADTLSSQREIVATYPYHDDVGKLLFEVVRFRPKDFRQRRPDPAALGGYTWSMKGVARVPYRLPEVLAAVKEDRPVFVCEGEKDCDNLRAAGFVATCNPGGAGKWLPTFAPYFSGADVVLCGDNDAPGRRHVAEIFKALTGTAKSIHVLTLPGELNGRPVKDISDWLAAGGTAAELNELTQAAPTEAPALPPAENAFTPLLQDGADIMRMDLPPIVQIIEGIVAERAKLVIGSGSKSFKTWLAIDAGLSIAHGVTFLERATQRRRVLYVNLELKPETFQFRVQAVARAKGITVEPGWFMHLPLRGKLAGLSVHEIVELIIGTARHCHAGVTIGDPVYKLNVEGDENCSRDQALFFNELDRITTEGACTLILNDHFSKGNQADKDPLDAIRGSSAKGGDLDAAMVLRRHEVLDAYRVDLVHRELPPVEPFVLCWKYPLMAIRQDLNAEDMKRPGGRARQHDPLDLLAAIQTYTPANPVSVSEWARLADVKRQTLTNYLPAMRRADWIATAGEGSNARTYVTQAGQAVLATRKDANP